MPLWACPSLHPPCPNCRQSRARITPARHHSSSLLKLPPVLKPPWLLTCSDLPAETARRFKKGGRATSPGGPVSPTLSRSRRRLCPLQSLDPSVPRVNRARNPLQPNQRTQQRLHQLNRLTPLLPSSASSRNALPESQSTAQTTAHTPSPSHIFGSLLTEHLFLHTSHCLLAGACNYNDTTTPLFCPSI